MPEEEKKTINVTLTFEIDCTKEEREQYLKSCDTDTQMSIWEHFLCPWNNVPGFDRSRLGDDLFFGPLVVL